MKKKIIIFFTLIICLTFFLNCITSERHACEKEQLRGIRQPQKGTCNLFLLAAIKGANNPDSTGKTNLLNSSLIFCLQEEQVARECKKKSKFIPTTTPY